LDNRRLGDGIFCQEQNDWEDQGFFHGGYI
jgi:hypothetical protein